MIKKKIALVSFLLVALVGCGSNDDDSSPGASASVNVDCVKLPCFFAVETPSANLGGVSGADTLCQKNYSTAKAFIVDGVDRNASPVTVDWILDPNTEYFQIDGTSIGMTNGDSLFTFPLSAAFTKEPIKFWTGLNTSWEYNVNNCTKWTSTNLFGYAGDSTDDDSLSGTPTSCASSNVHLLCVAH